MSEGDDQTSLHDRILDIAARAARHPAVQTGISGLSLFELLHPGAGSVSSAIGSGVAAAPGGRMDHQARVTVDRLPDRVMVLEQQSKLDQEQLRREAEGTGIVVKGLLSAAQDLAEKTDSYADLLAGLVSTDRPEALDSAVLLSCVSRLEASTLG
jgi:hypothetical protein